MTDPVGDAARTAAVILAPDLGPNLPAHDTPGAARGKRTHLVHATCHRGRQPPRPAGNTVLQQTA